MATLASVIEAAQQEQAILAQREDAIDLREATMREEFERREAGINETMARLAQTNNQLQNQITLNVGGMFFTTSLSSLESEEGNLLLTGARHGNVMHGGNVEGAVFFDRDAQIFPYVINWLRSQACDTPFLAPETSRERQMLAIEAQYYLLPGLVAYLNQIVVDEDMSAIRARVSATHGGNGQQVVEYIQVSGIYSVETVRTDSQYQLQDTPRPLEEVRADIQTKINTKLSEGYSLYGNLEYNVDPKGKYGNATHFMIQAMVKYA